MKTRSIDRDDPECRFCSVKKHPNRKDKREFTLTINPTKMEDMLKAMKEKNFSSNDLSRTFFITPSITDIEWLNMIFDVDRPIEKLESPRSRILSVEYIDKNGKDRKKEIYFDGHRKSNGDGNTDEWVYWFDIHDIEEAEYLLPFVEKHFLNEDIRIYNPEYRESNKNKWRPLPFGGMI